MSERDIALFALALTMLGTLIITTWRFASFATKFSTASTKLREMKGIEARLRKVETELHVRKRLEEATHRQQSRPDRDDACSDSEEEEGDDS